MIDALGAGCQHDQPIKAESDAGRPWHIGERGHKILVQRIALAVNALFLGHRDLETHALFSHVREFAEGIGEFDPAGVKLETFSDFIAAGFCPRQRRQRQWVLI